MCVLCVVCCVLCVVYVCVCVCMRRVRVLVRVRVRVCDNVCINNEGNQLLLYGRLLLRSKLVAIVGATH